MVAVSRSHRTNLNDVAGGDRSLRLGANGAAVTSVQKLLNKKGAHLATDGDFGPKTQAALKHFQKTHGLRVTGAVDHTTLEKLEGPNVHHKDEFLKVGDRGTNVSGMERDLKRLGYDPGTVDGTYDANTARAVAAFKHDEALKQQHGGGITGNVQRQIRTELRGLHHSPLHTRIKPNREHRRLDAATATAAGRVDENGAAILGEGAAGRAVRNVQSHLRAAGFVPKHVDGKFDERTAGAVKAFQARSGLPATGRVDTATWNKLKKSQIEGATATSPAQTVGEHSGAVKHTEKLLKQLHIKTGAVDGTFDAKTAAGVRAFEKKHHLHVDGNVNTHDLKALEKAAKAAQAPNLKTVKGCAQFLLKSKNVSFWSGLSSGSDRANLERLAKGQKAFVPATGGHVMPKLGMMQALVDMAKHGPIMINALTGGTHSPNSNHYRGLAVDLDLSVGNTAQIESLARRHGGARNFERDHIHLDF
jgi:peptidoglycan hydrolase-like protein with peptidoglycan-binding domain